MSTPRPTTPMPGVDDSAGRAPALDALVGPADEPVTDSLSALLDESAAGENADELTPWHYEQLELLDDLKAQKRAAEEAAKAVGSRARKLQADVLEWIPDLELDPNQPFDRFRNARGEWVLPSIRNDIYPKYRERDTTGEQYTRDEVFPVLADTDAAHVVVPTLEATAWNKYVRDRVKAWRSKLARSPRGIRNDAGAWVDHDGQPLREHEVGRPNHDDLALPATIREMIEISVLPDIRFTRSAAGSKAAKALDAKLEASRAAAEQAPRPQD